MTLTQTAVSAASALGGGFAGGMLVAFRLGRWRQRIEDRLDALERRALRSDAAVDSITILNTRMDLVLEELRTIRAEMRQDRRQFVTREECNRSHNDA